MTAEEGWWRAEPRILQKMKPKLRNAEPATRAAALQIHIGTCDEQCPTLKELCEVLQERTAALNIPILNQLRATSATVASAGATLQRHIVKFGGPSAAV